MPQLPSLSVCNTERGIDWYSQNCVSTAQLHPACRQMLPCGTLLSLQLDNNRLSGTMSKNYSAVMSELALSKNSLSGTINQVLPCSLKALRVAYNQFSGTLSEGIASEAVAEFDVFGIRSQRQVCPLFGPTLASMITMSVGNNRISGTRTSHFWVCILLVHILLWVDILPVCSLTPSLCLAPTPFSLCGSNCLYPCAFQVPFLLGRAGRMATAAIWWSFFWTASTQDFMISILLHQGSRL